MYKWSTTEQGIIMGSFYIGYLLTHIPGGILAEIFGGKQVLGLGILFTALTTLIHPLVIQNSNGQYWPLVILRIIVGLGEGTTYPALTSLLGTLIGNSDSSCYLLIFMLFRPLQTILYLLFCNCYFLSTATLEVTVIFDFNTRAMGTDERTFENRFRRVFRRTSRKHNQ